jgi:hypothetical protein
MTEDYFKTLTPRQQLNDLMHKYAQERGGNYSAGWNELDRRWKKKHGSALSWLRWKYNQDHQTALTIPAYIETTGKMPEALAIGREMTGARLSRMPHNDRSGTGTGEDMAGNPT